jgi:hypothetical protein
MDALKCDQMLVVLLANKVLSTVSDGESGILLFHSKIAKNSSDLVLKMRI